jgi:glycosyltransferase involved in cell wall biosynthesis
MKLAIVSFGHADSIIHYAKTLSPYYDIDLFFVFSLNKRIESVLNFENEKLDTGFLSDEQAERILGNSIKGFINGAFRIKFFINYNLKIRSIKNIVLSRTLAKALENYDIIHFNGMDATILLINYFLKNKKKVFTIHDVKLHSGEKGKIYNVAESICMWLIKSKYQVLIQNKFDYNDIIKKYPDKIRKINLIPFKNLNIFKSFLNENLSVVKSDILFFGRISPYKGLNYLVDAIKMVNKVYPDIRVLIAGSGTIDRNIKEKLNGSFIIYNRYLSNEEMAGFVANTKIVVCPYTDASQSGVVMTSFAFGKPIIASNVGGFLDVIEDGVTGILVPPRNVDELAKAIISLLSDEKKIISMSKKITEECENGMLSWNSIINDANNVYQKTLEKKSSAKGPCK